MLVVYVLVFAVFVNNKLLNEFLAYDLHGLHENDKLYYIHKHNLYSNRFKRDFLITKVMKISKWSKNQCVLQGYVFIIRIILQYLVPFFGKKLSKKSGNF